MTFPSPRSVPLRGGPTARWGVLAPGEIAHDFVTTLHANTDQRVHAVGSRSRDRADRFASAHGIPRSYGSYRGLADDPDIDIVYVAAPNSEHRELALLAIAAGKHVLVEKPMGVDAADAAHIAAAARSAGVFAMEAMWSSYLPQFDVIGQILDSHELGEVRLVTADFGSDFSSLEGHAVFDPERGGGTLLDIGIYPIWFAHFVLGSPAVVHAAGDFTDTGVDGQASMILSGDDDAQALLSTTLYASTPIRASIAGTRRLIDIASPFLMPGGFELISAGASETWTDDSGLRGRDGLAWQATAVAQHIDDGLLESPVHPLATTIAVLATIDEVRSRLAQTL